MTDELAAKFAEDMAYVILQNPKANDSLTECLLTFFSCIDGGDKNSVSSGLDDITVFIDGEKHHFQTASRPYIDVLKEIFYKTYYLPLLSKP
ncbi:hypothetical protein [Pantoea sp. MT58]|uniref:hypothetical protein n=1 Tax=Pantoea sp. MT58 TaxID=2768165 RepID=UPI00165C45B7|nr:hypothetical protein [Pantoea sp. MT58]QNQ61223.1 hypothetical protein IAI47_21905 [Pantoea sp. MT58]